MAKNSGTTDLDKRLRERGIGLTLDEQRERMIERHFEGSTEKYYQATMSVHSYFWKLLEEADPWNSEHHVTFIHPAVHTGAYASWEEDETAPINCGQTTPSGALVHTEISLVDVTTRTIRLPEMEQGPSLESIGRGIALLPVIQRALIDSYGDGRTQLVRPTINDVIAVSGMAVSEKGVLFNQA